MSVKLIAASVAALVAGGGTATGLSLAGAYGPTTTVEKPIVKTITETTPADSFGEGGDGDTDTTDDIGGDGCSDSYEGACLDPSDGYNDVNCTDILDTDFDSVGDDPYALDRDADGIACESY